MAPNQLIRDTPRLGHPWWYYTPADTTTASQFDIDHLVPLAEAWNSGASTWAQSTRVDFANGIGDIEELVPVKAGTNRSKGDRDPAEWLPPNAAFRCTYAVRWVSIKVRWGLSADPAEYNTLSDILNAC